MLLLFAVVTITWSEAASSATTSAMDSIYATGTVALSNKNGTGLVFNMDAVSPGKAATYN